MLTKISRVCKRLFRERQGNFAVMTAVCAPFAIVLAAFAVDEGSLYTERRSAQSLTDLAAITAAANLGAAETAAVTTFSDNGITAVVEPEGTTVEPTTDNAVLNVIRGHYKPDAAIAASERFQAGQQPFNAVRVTLRKKGSLFFGAGIMAPPTIGTTAVARTSAQAAFSIGSRLVSVDTTKSPLLNALLGGLLGTKVSLSAMDYDALLKTDIDVLEFLDQLAVKLDLTGGTYSDVLAADATITQIVNAMADIPDLDGTSKAALQAMIAGSHSSVELPLKQIIDFGSAAQLKVGQKPPGLDIAASALQMLTVAAALANGNNQMALDLNNSIPGLSNIQLKLAIGEPPQSSSWVTIGEEGAIVRTAQTRLRLTADVDVGGASLPIGYKLLGIHLPLNVEVAYGEAKLTDISCPAGHLDRPRVTLAVRPGVVSAALADNDSAGFADFTRQQTFHDAVIATASVNLLFLHLPLVQLIGSAYPDLGDQAPISVTFSYNEFGTTKTIKTSNFTQSLTSSLISGLTLDVKLLNLDLKLVSALLGVLKGPVVDILGTLTKPIDGLLNRVLEGLGVGLGEVDIRVTGATCGRSVLVL
ncbi:TadG family pilus assembly protein [Manganibacter manganicus]|uniref:DUF2134 domain-containing protein n=1 Tax=Manganibacter manganicus TaxID=1873176 RepID=A0A1V8RPQ6_9HYPH|nr:TadG family pilus assembly protein [Pseudaminobacter manganicus]OQM75177.1 hypothetical protein BFN67_19375 [Pseudaminobacter manganicus]